VDYLGLRLDLALCELGLEALEGATKVVELRVCRGEKRVMGRKDKE